MRGIRKQINPSAVVLKYRQSQENAPTVVARGKNLIAEKIMALAIEHDLPIIKNPELLNMLMTVEINEPIPREAFETVAAIYAFLIELDEKYAKILA